MRSLILAFVAATCLAATFLTSPAAFAKDKPVELCKDKQILAIMNDALKDGNLDGKSRKAMSYGVLFNRVVHSSTLSQTGRITTCKLTIELRYGGQSFNKRGTAQIETYKNGEFSLHFSAFQ